jgi:hypothetical protein
MDMPAPDGRRSGSGLLRFYSIKTVAEACEVSTRTVKRWIVNGDLIVHRVNGEYLQRVFPIDRK